MKCTQSIIIVGGLCVLFALLPWGGSCSCLTPSDSGGDGRLFVVLPSATTHSTTNQSVIDMVHNALNNTFPQQASSSSSSSFCSYYPSMYVASNTSCTHTTTTSLSALALLQDGHMYIRAGATLAAISAASGVPTDPTDPTPIIFDASNDTHLNGSSGYMGAVCADHWGSDLLLHYVASLLSSHNDVVEAIYYISPTTSNTTSNNITSLAAVLNDNSLNAIYTTRVADTVINSGVSTQSSLSTMGAVWGLLFGVISSINGTTSQSADAVISTFISTAGAPSSSSSMSVPWYGWIAFVFGGLFAVGSIVVLCGAILRIYCTWDVVSKADYGQIAREGRQQLGDLLRTHWWNKDGSNNEHTSNPNEQHSPDWVGGRVTNTTATTWSPTRSGQQQHSSLSDSRNNNTAPADKTTSQHKYLATATHGDDGVLTTTTTTQGHDLPPHLNPVIALMRGPAVERLRRALTTPKDLVDEANNGGNIATKNTDDSNDSCVIELHGRRRRPHSPLNKSMLVAQQLGERAVFKTFVHAYKDDQAKMYTTLGRQGPIVTQMYDDGVERLVDTTTNETGVSPPPSYMYKIPTPINTFLNDRITLQSPTPSSSQQPTSEEGKRKVLLRGFPTVVPFLLLSVALLFSMVAVLLLAVGVESIEYHPSHTAVVLGYVSPSCDQSLLDSTPKQAWFVAVGDTCEVAEMVGAARALAPTLFIKASCQFDVASSTSHLTVSMGETYRRCESAPTTTISTQLLNDTSSSSSSSSNIASNVSDYCVSSDKLLLGGPLHQHLSMYLTGVCVPTSVASNTLNDMHERRSQDILGDGGSREVIPSTPFNPATEGFNPNDDLVRMRIGNEEENPLLMRPFIASKTIGFVSPVIDEVLGGDGGGLSNLTTPLITVNGERPVASFEHSGTRSTSNAGTTTLSARGFSFSTSLSQNTSAVLSSSSSNTAASVIPLVQSPLRFLGVDGTVFDLGLHTQFTMNFWMRANRQTRGYVLAVANDWHGGDGSPGTSNVILEALSYSISRGAGSNLIAGLVGSEDFKMYSAVALDGPTSLMSLQFGGGGGQGSSSSSVSWDLSRLKGFEGRSALDGEWHMMTIQSDVKSGWRYFHLLVDSQTSYTDPEWHQCTASDNAFSPAAPQGATVQAPSSIANITRTRTGATVAYVGYGFGGGASIAALQIFTKTATGDAALRKLASPSMTPSLSGLLVLAAVLFGVVLVGAIVAVVQVVYRSRVDTAKQDATIHLSGAERVQLQLATQGRSKKAGKKAINTAVTAGVQVSKMYTAVRQLSMENGSAVSRLRTIYPQFAAVCQAMAIYLASWGWPDVFYEFATQLTFLFSFNFDLAFPSIPSIAMPLAQIILCGMLLVLAVFLVIHDQKQFYLAAIGATAFIDDEEEKKDESDEDDSLPNPTPKPPPSSLPDNYDFFLDCRMHDQPPITAEKQRYDPIGPLHKAATDPFETNGFVTAVTGRGEDELAPTTTTTNHATNVGGSDQQAPSRMLDIRPHTRFRFTKKVVLNEGSDHPNLATNNSHMEPIYTFALLKTNRYGAKPTRNEGGVGWYEWRCSEGIVYTPRAKGHNNNDSGERLQSDSPCFTLRISELVAALQRGDKSAVGNILDDTEMSSSPTDLAFPVYVVRGTPERATASSPNWHESSIPDLHAGMPPPSSLATYAFDTFMQVVSLSAHHAGLHLERGTLKFVKDPITQSYTFEFHCVEVIRGAIGRQFSELPQPQTSTEEPNAVVYTVAPDRDCTTRCPRHMCPMIPYRRSFHSECTTCSNSYHADCATYLRTDGRKCSGTIALVCKEENCGYCLCADGCAGKVGIQERILQLYHSYIYLFWNTNINYILGFFILILGQSLFLPVVQSASMIAVCHVDYQCDFPRCYEQMTTKYGVSLYFAFLALVLTLSVMVPFFTFMLVKRKLFLLENRLVEFEGDYESMSLLSRILVEIDEEDWDLFLLSDGSILRALYEMYEFRYIAIHGLLLLFKVFLLLPVLFMPRNSVGQLALAGGVEVGLLLLLTVTDAFINPWMDALARVGSFHQILQVALVALSRVLDEWAAQIGITMICVSVVYIIILLVVIVHEILLPYLHLRRLRAAETELFRVRNLALKWLELSDVAAMKEGLTATVLISEYFSADVLSGKVDPLLSSSIAEDLPPQIKATDDNNESELAPKSQEYHIFEKVERELLKTSQSKLAESTNPHLEQISVPYTHLINKAIRTTPNDPQVYTALADRLQRMLFTWDRMYALAGESKPWKKHGDNSPPQEFMYTMMFTTLDKEAYKHFKIEESDEKKFRRRRRFYENVMDNRIISSELKPGSYHNRCPCVYVHGEGYMSLLEIQSRAIETSPMDANLCAGAASSLIEFMYAGETISVSGEDVSVAELLAMAVERAPGDIVHKRRLVDYLCLRAELFAKAGMPVNTEVVNIFGEECDVVRICELQLERSPNSSESYVLIAQTMSRCQSVHLLKPTPSTPSPPTPAQLDSSPSLGMRDVFVYGRAIHRPKEVLLFAIEILSIVDADLLIALAEALVHEENQSWHAINNNSSAGNAITSSDAEESKELGIVSMLSFGKCSAVDVLAMALVAHPRNHKVYTALQASLKRPYTYMRAHQQSKSVNTTSSGVELHQQDVVSLGGEGGGGSDNGGSMSDMNDGEESADPYDCGYSVVDDESMMGGDFVHYAAPKIEPAFYGEYSQAVVSGCSGIGRNTNSRDFNDDNNNTNPKYDSASWVMARFGWINIIDIAAAEYLQNCERRSEVFDQLTRLMELLKSRSKKDKKCSPYAYSIQMGIQRHPKQAQRCTHDPLPVKWSMKEVIEHAIFHHPDYTDLYLMLFEWCLQQPGVVFGDIRIILPMSEARRDALGVDEDYDDGTPTSSSFHPPATTVSISEIWGVLLEHDWGNPAAYVALSKYCEPLAYQRDVKFYQKALEMAIPVYLPAAASSLLPPSAQCTNNDNNCDGTAYLVKLNSVGALSIALHISPRDLTLYTALEVAMNQEEIRRRYLAYRCARGGKKGLCDVSEVVERHFQPNSGGLICLIPFVSAREGVYCNVHDVVCLAAEMCGQVVRRYSITSAANMKTFSKIIPTTKRMGIVEPYDVAARNASASNSVSDHNSSCIDSNNNASVDDDDDEDDDDEAFGDMGESRLPTTKPSPPASTSSFTMDTLCRLMFGADDLSHTTSQLLDPNDPISLDLLKATTTPTSLDQDLQHMVTQVQRVVSQQQHSIASRAEVIRRMYYLQLVVLGARRDSAQFANLLHCRFRLFGQSWVGPSEVKMTFLTHNEVMTSWSPSAVEVKIVNGGDKDSDEDSYNNNSDYDDEVGSDGGTPSNNGDGDAIPLMDDEVREEVVRRPLVLQSPLTPAQRCLYLSCSFAVDENGAPFRRTTDTRNDALPEGCAVTVLASESELHQYIGALSATRRRFKQLFGEESGVNGEEWSEGEQ